MPLATFAPPPDDAPPDLRDRILPATETAGRVPAGRRVGREAAGRYGVKRGAAQQGAADPNAAKQSALKYMPVKSDTPKYDVDTAGAASAPSASGLRRGSDGGLECAAADFSRGEPAPRGADAAPKGDAHALVVSEDLRDFPSISRPGAGSQYQFDLSTVALREETRDDPGLAHCLPSDYVRRYLVSRKLLLPDLLAMTAACPPRGAMVSIDLAMFPS